MRYFASSGRAIHLILLDVGEIRRLSLRKIQLATVGILSL
jgi:hypothetical protein